MKRSMRVALMVAGVLALASTASAGDFKFQNSKNWSGVKQNMLRKLGVPGQNYNLSKKKKKEQQQQQQPQQQNPEPWKEQGDVFGQPNGQPQDRPGYVFVDGHWQRERAPQNPVPQTVTPVQPQVKPGYVFVDGHWQRVRASDNAANYNFGYKPSGTTQPVDERDHRAPRPSRVPTGAGGGGSTAVQTIPGTERRDSVITSEGPGLHNLFGLIQGFEAPPAEVPIIEHRDGRLGRTDWTPNRGK